MKASTEEPAQAAKTVESLQLELNRCQHELAECRKRMEQTGHSEALLAGENRLLEMVTKGCSLTEILTALCQLIEELSSGCLCGIVLVDAIGTRLEHGAAPSLPTSYNEAIHGWPVNTDSGPCATAAYLKEQVIAADIASDTRWEAYAWCPLALSHGLGSCWSTPILSSEGAALGVFAIYWREPRNPTSQDQKLIKQTTHLASVAIERKRSQDALQASEDRFRRMADTIPEVIWFTGLEPERVLYVSPSFERIWGVPVKDIYRNPRLWTETIHPEDRERVINMFSRWIAGEKVSYHNIEYRIVQPGGAIRWIHERGVLTLNEQGKARLASGISTDITERKRAEEELRRGAAYLAEAQRLSLTGSFGWNVSSGELIWSKETFRILGYDPATKPTIELVFKRVHPDDFVRVQQTIDGSARGGAAFDFEHRWLMPDGMVKHLHVVARPTKTESGGVEFVGAVMDVTERKHSQEAMRAAKARFEGILEIAEDAIISVGFDQRILLFNKGAEKVFGYAQAEVIGKPINVLLPQRFNHAHMEHIREFGKSSEISRLMAQRREVFGRRKDGREFPAEASISKLDLGGELVFTVILRDITERKRAAEALRASEQLACGQVVALTRTMDALAMESAPDRLVEHVLRTITGQLNAHGISVWKKDEASGLVGLEFAFEDGKLVTKSDVQISLISLSLPAENIWPWPEVFRTGKPSLLEDIRLGPDFPWRDHLLSQGVITILLVPMLIAGQVDGVIGIRFTRLRAFRPEEIELAQALAHQARLAMQLTCLSVQSRQSAVMAERNRMARDVHDTLAQGFTGVIVQLEAAADATSKGLAQEAGAHLERAGELARESLREARRSVRALRPQALEENHWSEALEGLIKKMTGGTGLRSEFVLRGQPMPLPADWEENLLRIGQEVLTNALRHACATEFKTKLVFAPEEIRLELRDNGRGFDPESKQDGFGLLGVRERVEGMGGQIAIRSAEGSGSTILITLPLKSELQAAGL